MGLATLVQVSAQKDTCQLRDSTQGHLLENTLSMRNKGFSCTIFWSDRHTFTGLLLGGRYQMPMWQSVDPGIESAYDAAKLGSATLFDCPKFCTVTDHSAAAVHCTAAAGYTPQKLNSVNQTYLASSSFHKAGEPADRTAAASASSIAQSVKPPCFY
jgi:hypothetical protein